MFYLSAYSKRLMEGVLTSEVCMIVERVEHINDAIHNWMLNLVAVNVGRYYRQSPSFGGWQREAKGEELVMPGMQYLLAHEDSKEVPLPRGFLSYLVCEEEGADGDPRRVVYIYEVQVERSYTGKGIGSMLMDALVTRIATDSCLPRELMLTCFKANRKAIQFYQKHGFKEDEISPGRCKIRSDYVILSKKI